MKIKLLILNILVIVQLVMGRKFKIRRLTPADGWPMLHTGSKYASVFGVKVIAQATVCNKNLQYAANMLAQLLDGNEDGLPDDKRVTTQLQKHKSALLIYSIKKGVVSKNLKTSSHSFQILVTKQCSKSLNQKTTLTAILRLIATYGFSPAYPWTLGIKKSSILHESLQGIIGDCGYAHDKTLRWPNCTGLVFYNDSSCDAGCMAIEYLVQLMTISLGGFPVGSGKRFWDVRTKGDLLQKDPQGYGLMKLIKQKLPTKVPNGDYRPGRNGYRIVRIPSRENNTDYLKLKIIEVKI